MDPHIDADPEYYWIRVDDDGEWEPALKHGDGWERCGSEVGAGFLGTASVIEIGPRIPTPPEMTAAVKAEREACAKIADEVSGPFPGVGSLRDCKKIADAIRARN